jgi:hypothetical protein
MTENFDRFPNQSKPPAATMQDESAVNDKISTYSNVKNFTSETNNDADADCIINEIEKEGQITRRSIALLNRNIHELIILLKDKKTIDREQVMRLGPSSSSYR